MTTTQREGALASATGALLFAPLGATNMANAVVDRLRAAIALGLLGDGTRLPRESDLANTLGVTVFALREALSTLRDQGLVVTRAGKHGGSFVTLPNESEQLEREALPNLSSAELRDLGDWRIMLAAQAAELAAQRATEATVEALALFASGVRSAVSGPDARRAHGRFFLELAASAQSMRLTRAEFRVHEQIDWLFGLVLGSAEARSAGADALAQVVQAVETRDPVTARRRTILHLTGLIDRLAQLRLQAIADHHHASVTAKDARPLPEEIAALLKDMLGQLASFAEGVAPVMGAAVSQAEVRNGISIVGVQHFANLPEFVEGVGVVAEVGVVPETSHWIQWWRRTEDGPVPDNHHVMDPSREDFYDYEQKSYIAHPRKTHLPWAHGPYVDYGGENSFILSLAHPILSAGRFLGVTVIDIPVARLEFWLAPALAGANESYLLNHEGQVVLSNTAFNDSKEIHSKRRQFDTDNFPEVGWTLWTRRSTSH